MIQKSIVVLSLVLSVFFSTRPVYATVWNQNRVLSDADLENYASMSTNDIQTFLLQKGSLGAYATIDIDGKIRSAAEIIDRVARAYKINPQFLLALIQKEQGVVEGKTPSEDKLAWAAGYSVCDRCDKDHPLLLEYKGFAKQLEAAANRIRNTYLIQLDTTGKTLTGWGLGITKYLSGVKITPMNRTTAALYTYTPHVSGNHLLWRIWQKWFAKKYPDGSLLTSDYSKDDTVYLIQNGLKRPITSKATLLSRFDLNKIITVTREELDGYNVGAPIQFPDFSLLRSPEGGVYLTDGDTRRPIVSQEIFRALGFNEDELINVSWEELDAYTDGTPLSHVSLYPRGGVLKNQKTGEIFYVQDGKKYPVWAEEILKTRFSNRHVTTVTPEELAMFETDVPIRFAEGELVGRKEYPNIYIISGDRRNPIPSAEVFEGMGWRWENVIWAEDKALSLHRLGEPVFLEEPAETIMATVR